MNTVIKHTPIRSVSLEMIQDGETFTTDKPEPGTMKIYITLGASRELPKPQGGTRQVCQLSTGMVVAFDKNIQVFKVTCIGFEVVP